MMIQFAVWLFLIMLNTDFEIQILKEIQSLLILCNSRLSVCSLGVFVNTRLGLHSEIC